VVTCSPGAIVFWVVELTVVEMGVVELEVGALDLVVLPQPDNISTPTST
jgi:hypothetical protein